MTQSYDAVFFFFSPQSPSPVAEHVCRLPLYRPVTCLMNMYGGTVGLTSSQARDRRHVGCV